MAYIMLLSMCLGFIISHFVGVPSSSALIISKLPYWFLCAILFIVAFDAGCRKERLKSMFKANISYFLIPAGTIAGTLVGAAFASLFIAEDVLDAVSVASGFGWYSYAGVFLTQTVSVELGTVAFLSNILREILAIISIPFISRHFGAACAISAAGSTSMDVCLPLIVRCNSVEYSIISFFHGTVLSFVTPMLLPVLLSLRF